MGLMKYAIAKETVWNGCNSPTSDEATRFAKELGCEKLRPQLLGLMESLGLRNSRPA